MVAHLSSTDQNVQPLPWSVWMIVVCPLVQGGSVSLFCIYVCRIVTSPLLTRATICVLIKDRNNSGFLSSTTKETTLISLLDGRIHTYVLVCYLRTLGLGLGVIIHRIIREILLTPICRVIYTLGARATTWVELCWPKLNMTNGVWFDTIFPVIWLRVHVS